MIFIIILNTTVISFIINCIKLWNLFIRLAVIELKLMEKKVLLLSIILRNSVKF